MSESLDTSVAPPRNLGPRARRVGGISLGALLGPEVAQQFNDEHHAAWHEAAAAETPEQRERRRRDFLAEILL